MSAANAKKTAKNKQPALVTTGQGAALSVTLGITLMIVGFLWLFSMMVSPRSSYILDQMSLTLYGLCGPTCPALPVLLVWAGVKLTVSARHKVAARDVLIVAALYWLFLAAQTLLTHVMQGTSSPAYLDYVGSVNFQGIPPNHDDYADFLYLAFKLDTKTGGMLGMLLAYPLWKLLTRIGAIAAVIASIITLVFILFRINPGDIFRKVSDQSEQRRIRREDKQAQVEQEKAAKNAQQNPPAPPVQELPINSVNPGQTVIRQETVYPTPDYYPPAPVYSAQPPAAQQQDYDDSSLYPQTAYPAPHPDAQGFYPVQPDLYDARFPLNTDSTAPADFPADAPAWQQPPAPEAHAEESSPVERSLPRALRRRYRDQSAAAKEEKQPAAALAAQREAPDQPAQAEARPAASAARPQQEKPADSIRPSRPASVPIKEPAVYAEDTEDDDLPWEAPRAEAGKKRQAAASKGVPARAEAQSASRPAAKDDWAAQVQRKQAEMSQQELPVHTTAKNDPKPVHTDPVMPLDQARGTITQKKENPSPNVKLDGTSAPQIKQGSMNISVPYQAPPIRLLSEGRHAPQENMAQEDERRAEIIEGTLRSFGVESEVRQIMHGPAITRFAIQIAPGVKVSRVSNTADNLALDLKTKHVRVEAPIQGTSYIGIEVPNQLVSTVSLREVLDSPEMRSNPSPLVVALGKDIAGAPVLCDLSKMPHLLIAGATGSGKSVCINSIVCSLLYRTSPDQVRLIMVDPKQVELSVYNGIPHLLVPVVSDPRKASGALAWVVQEMLERYGKFSAQGVRNLAGYNKVNQGTDQVLPNIVVIIDEMADLMEVCRKDVEESIRRLAALARAAGIYMVLATQRPSVDVITGVIKNNIPSRIAFAVSSGTDSRTIIDINGAEKLMGKGDMLYKPAGTSPVRVQGCFVSDEEVNAVADYISSRYQTNYDPNIAEHLENAGKDAEADEAKGFDDGLGGAGMAAGGNEGEFQDLLQQAIEMAVEDGQTSTSMLQRRLRVGYARAGRLIDEMEKRGIISQSEGSKPRKTVITREQYYEMMREQ